LKPPWHGLSAQAKRGLLAHALHWQAVSVGQLYVSIFLFHHHPHQDQHGQYP
jgi:hypothetical protein